MLEEGRRGAGGDHEHCAVKEEIVSSAAGVLGPGVDLNIGLPVGGSCDDDEYNAMEEEEEDDVEEEEIDESNPAHGGCKVEKHQQGETAGSNNTIDMGEFGVAGAESGVAMSCRYWIPTQAQILVGPVQFVCHVCNKNFNRYNNMQVNDFYFVVLYTYDQLISNSV
jgi:hypothetical protein